MDGETTPTIPTNLRLLLVIEAVARAGVPVTPTEVNEELGLPKPTIHRLFATLEDEGFLQRDLDGRSYSPGQRLRRTASDILSSLRIRAARQAILKKLSGQVGETCNIALPDRDAMLYIDRFETEWPLRIQLPIGTRVPFYCTASGKMYLSTLAAEHRRQYIAATDLAPRAPNTITDAGRLTEELSQIRRQGYSLDREEFLPDMIALAVPIAAPGSRLLATLSFHAPTQRLDIDTAISHLDDLRNAASALAALIGD